MPVTGPQTYGLLAAFASADELVDAARRTHAAGYTHVEAFAPYPMEEVEEALGYRRNGVAFLVFVGGLCGGCSAFFMLYWIEKYGFALNVGGKPLNSWPMWIPITFEVTVLTAGLSSFFSCFVLNGLPRYHHPLFECPLFAENAFDGFYIYIEATDPQFQLTTAREFLADLHSYGIAEVRDGG